MRDAEKTIGNIIDKQKICHLSSDDGGQGVVLQ